MTPTRSFLLLALFATTLRAEVFTIAQYGDIHADFGRTLQRYATNTIPWILSKTNDGDLNIRIVVSAGDCYESGGDFLTTNQNVVDELYHGYEMTNDVYRLITNGLLTFIADGNHDNDNTNGLAGWSFHEQSTNLWNSVFPYSWFVQQPGWVTSRFAGDSKQMVMKYTNGNIKLLFISYHSDPETNNILATYQPQTTWVSNTIASYPDHNAIIVAHSMLGTNITPDTTTGDTFYWNTGPTIAPFAQGITALPNLAMFLSGHNRQLFKGTYRTNGTDGHSIFVNCFNTQTGVAIGIDRKRSMDFVNLFTFDTVKQTVRCRTWCISEARYLVNYETAAGFYSTALPQGFEHTWEMALPIRPVTYPVLRR